MPRNPSPDATLTSTAPSPTRSGRLGALKALILVAALAWVGKMIVDSIQAVRHGDLVLHVSIPWLALSGVIVLATYFLLVWAWLYIVGGLSGRSIPLLAGARIWFISNLGTLLPGRVWGIVQMGAMSADAGIQPVAAGAAAVINAAVNIATGMAVSVIAGAPILAAYFGDRALIAWILAALASAGVIALPVLVPWAFRVARRLGARIPEQSTPPRVIAVSTLVNIAAWFLYGAAFLCLNRGVVDPAASSVVRHTAAFATSYVIGYLAIVFPGGIGVREASLTGVLLAGGMATAPQASALSVISRLWLLIIQVLPALIFLAYRRPSFAYRRPPDEKDPAAG